MSELSFGLVKADIIAAGQCIEYFEQKKIKDIKNIAAYHLQQACEKLIKIQIYHSGKKYDEAQVYSHNLRNLYRYAVSLQVDLIVPKEIENNMEMITRWEAGSRYDTHFSIRISTLRKYHALTDEWYEKVKSTRH